MTDDDRQKTEETPDAGEAERTRSGARGAELRSELAITDARRAEEETAEAHEAVEQATEREEKLSGKEQKAQQRAKAAEDEAERARKQAEAVAQRTTTPRPAAAPAATAAPVAGSDRPEVLVGAAFAGAFVLARILKRLVD